MLSRTPPKNTQGRSGTRCLTPRRNAFEPSCMHSNLHSHTFGVKVRMRGSQPSILVRTFSLFTRYAGGPSFAGRDRVCVNAYEAQHVRRIYAMNIAPGLA